MKKILILNGSHSDIPLIKAAKEMGLFVITTGNNPELIGHKYTDKYVNGDYSDCEKMLEIAKQEKIDYVCSCANDFGIISASYVAEKLGLGGHDSYETTLTLHHKDKFKEFALKNNLLTAEAKGFDNKEDAIEYALSLDYEIIIKPIDLTGGKGISRAVTDDEKIKAIEKAFEQSLNKRIVVERFINGTYHCLSVFIRSGKVIYAYADNEYSDHRQFYVTTGAAPAKNFDSVKDILLKEAEKVASLLKLVDGKLHMQYIMGEDGKPYVIEYMRRLAGDFYCYPVSKTLNIDAAKLVVSAECGFDLSDYKPNLNQKGYIGYHIVMAPKNGLLKQINYKKELNEKIFDRVSLCDYPFLVKDNMVDKMEIVFFECGNYTDLLKYAENINDYIDFVFEKQ